MFKLDNFQFEGGKLLQIRISNEKEQQHLVMIRDLRRKVLFFSNWHYYTDDLSMKFCKSSSYYTTEISSQIGISDFTNLIKLFFIIIIKFFATFCINYHVADENEHKLIPMPYFTELFSDWQWLKLLWQTALNHSKMSEKFKNSTIYSAVALLKLLKKVQLIERRLFVWRNVAYLFGFLFKKTYIPIIFVVSRKKDLRPK